MRTVRAGLGCAQRGGAPSDCAASLSIISSASSSSSCEGCTGAWASASFSSINLVPNCWYWRFTRSVGASASQRAMTSRSSSRSLPAEERRHFGEPWGLRRRMPRREYHPSFGPPQCYIDRRARPPRPRPFASDCPRRVPARRSSSPPRPAACRVERAQTPSAEPNRPTALSGLLTSSDGGTAPRSRQATAARAGDWAHIAAGRFVAGSTPGDEGRDPRMEPTPLTVTVTPYEIDLLPYPNDPASPPRVDVPRRKRRGCAKSAASDCVPSSSGKRLSWWRQRSLRHRRRLGPCV